MKIAVYAIALNEEQFVERWYESAKDADYLLIADTGSTDKTVKLAKSLGINVPTISIKPWRFDDARNASLAYIPDNIDYCIALDLDEILLPGWRAELEKSFEAKATRPRYKYTWSWNPDGTPGLQYGGDKIHSRHGYRWKHPVHEVMLCDRIEQVEHWNGLEIHHHPDSTKSRSEYLPLLAVSVQEDPHNDRNAFYYGRELYFYKKFEEATVQLKRYLALPTACWNVERGGAMRLLAECEPESKEVWLKQSLKESYRRESLVDLAQYYYEISNWESCLEQAKAALAIEEKPLDYMCEAEAWGGKPYDLAAISAYHLGKLDLAFEYGEKALALSPNDERLKNNLDYYREA